MVVAASFNLLFRVGIVFSVTSYCYLVFPFIFGALYLLQYYYLRTFRHIRRLEVSSEAALSALFSETADGLRHIRSFGHQMKSLQLAFQLVDRAQKPHYCQQVAQQWLSFVVDMITFVTVALLVPLTLHSQLPATVIGLSLVSLIPMNIEVSSFVLNWTKLQGSLGSLARVRAFIKDTPVEPALGDREIELPKKAKENGRVLFKNVVAKYR